MAPFRRGRSAQPESPGVEGPATPTTNASNRSKSAWERRRARNARSANGDHGEESKTSRRKPDKLPEDEYDPYDSDPGESYREHCMRIKGVNSRSCLAMPRFLNNKKAIMPEQDTEATSPPSPLASEVDEFGGMPPSLARDMSRVRYSLRTSIGDGSAKQPTGPTVMERRPLRPNNIHINVSVWSDTGARNYMEDRWVFACLLPLSCLS